MYQFLEIIKKVVIMGVKPTEGPHSRWLTPPSQAAGSAETDDIGELAALTSIVSRVFTSGDTADTATDPNKPVMCSVADPLELASTREYLLHRSVQETREWLENRTKTNKTELINPNQTEDKELIKAQNLYIFMDCLLSSINHFYKEPLPYVSERPLLSEDFFQLLELKSIFNSKLSMQEKAKRIKDWINDNQPFLSKIEHLIISVNSLPSVRFLTEIPKEINLCTNCLSLSIQAPLIKSISDLSFPKLNQLFLDCRNLGGLCYFSHLPKLGELEIVNSQFLHA